MNKHIKKFLIIMAVILPPALVGCLFGWVTYSYGIPWFAAILLGLCAFVAVALVSTYPIILENSKDKLFP